VITFTVTGGTVNIGQMAGRITNTESTIQGVANQGDDRTAEGLRDVGQAVLDEPSLDDETRRDLLDQVQFLAESAQQEPTKRKRGVVRQALAVLEDAATAGTKIGAAMNVWGEVLHKILS
jgi:hypothetical protein